MQQAFSHMAKIIPQKNEEVNKFLNAGKIK